MRKQNQMKLEAAAKSNSLILSNNKIRKVIVIKHKED